MEEDLEQYYHVLIREKQSDRNKRIEEYLKKEKKEYLRLLREPKLLILGTSDSGKSTLLKQIRILHGNGFQEEEKKAFREAMKANIILNITNVVNHVNIEILCTKLEVKFD